MARLRLLCERQVIMRHARVPQTSLAIGPWASGWVCLIVLTMLTGVVSARTISVPGNSPSIKGAMIQARAGDIILVSCGTYREANIQVKPGVSLWSGTLQPDCVTIDADGQGRCLLFSEADTTTSVAGFTLRGGQAHGSGIAGWGGAVLCVDSAPRITRCIMTGNRADHGGALAATGRRGPRLEMCELTANEAESQGGAVHWSAANGALVGCTMQRNHASLRGGAFSGQDGDIVFESCLLRDNSAGNVGGALNLHRTDALLQGTILAANQGGLSGGALACREASPVLRQCTLHANEADGDGTVLSLDRAHPTLDGCLVTGSGERLVAATDSQPVIRQSNVFGHQGSQWPGILANLQTGAGNLAADPLYCAPTAGDFHLRANSPCLAGNGGAHIGALGQGCGSQFPPDVLD